MCTHVNETTNEFGKTVLLWTSHRCKNAFNAAFGLNQGNNCMPCEGSELPTEIAIDEKKTAELTMAFNPVNIKDLFSC